MRAARSIPLVLLLIATAATAAEQTGQKIGEDITATAITPAGKAGLPPSTATIEISITRWSTDAERYRLADALKSGRANTLLEALRGLPAVGHIATATSAGWSLRFAQTRSLDDGGRQILLATDRPVTVGETQRHRGETDYPISVVDIRFDKDGTGTGTVAFAANLTYDKKTGAIAIENYGGDQVRLAGVKSTATH